MHAGPLRPEFGFGDGFSEGSDAVVMITQDC